MENGHHSYFWDTAFSQDWSKVKQDAILWVSLKDTEILELRRYLESEAEKSVSDDEFERYMEATFYNGSPIDSWFNLEKFLQVCHQLQISPTMFYYRYELILTLNMK